MVTSLRSIAAITIFIGLLLAGLTSRQTTTDAAALMSAVQSPSPTPTPCPASQSWITSTTPPQEIGSPNPPPVSQETNCQFYQFSWQWFLSLVQPSTSSPGNRVFETLNVFQPDVNNQCKNLKATGKAAAAKALFVRLRKPTLATIQPVTPGELSQATGQPLYDQNGNIVFYNVFYNPTECQATSAGFKPNTVEIKISWKKLTAPDPTYYTMEANVEGQQMLLGLVGFHLVINTALHPEFVWATWEHVGNDPDCINPPPVPSSGWSFISKTCSTCPSSCGTSCNLMKCAPAACNVNAIPKPIKNPPLTGTANQICRVYPDGTDPGSMTNGNNNDTNRFNIDTLNQQIPQGYLAQLPESNPMKIWQNYFMIGGLWTNGGVPSTGTDVQRGSLELANTTMETFFQEPKKPQIPQNCFTCHRYVVPPPATNNPLRVSHLACSLFPISMTGCPQKLLIQAKKPAVIRKPAPKK
jgi:hypothetical protein